MFQVLLDAAEYAAILTKNFVRKVDVIEVVMVALECKQLFDEMGHGSQWSHIKLAIVSYVGSPPGLI